MATGYGMVWYGMVGEMVVDGGGGSCNGSSGGSCYSH